MQPRRFWSNWSLASTHFDPQISANWIISPLVGLRTIMTAPATCAGHFFENNRLHHPAVPSETACCKGRSEFGRKTLQNLSSGGAARASWRSMPTVDPSRAGVNHREAISA